MNQDIMSKTKSYIALAPIVINSDTTTQTEIIDTKGFNSGKIIMATGVVTAGQIVISEINESDNAAMVGETVIPVERLYGNTLANTVLDASGTLTEIGFVTTKEYIRFEIVSSGTANLLATAVVELGDAEQSGY